MQRGPISPKTSLLDAGITCLTSLCEAASFSPEAASLAAGVLSDVLAPWADVPVGTQPRTASDITDDHGPIEFSVAFTGSQPEVRVLFEATGQDTTMSGLWQQAERTNARLEEGHGADLGRLRSVQDLFFPRAEAARFGMWHSICFGGGGEPKFKVYLNPQARGPEHAVSLVTEAMRILGFSGEALELIRLSSPHEELRYFSLDLHATSKARVKVYKVHYNATLTDMTRAIHLRGHGTSEGALACFRLLAGSDGPLRRRPVSSYLAFTSSERPSSATFHFPVRDYVESDQVAYERVRALLDGTDRAIYENIIAAFARRPLSAGRGMHSYVSVRNHDGPQRITVYLAPELYHVQPSMRIAS